MKLRKWRTGLSLAAIIVVAAVMLVGSDAPPIQAQGKPLTVRRHIPASIHRVRDKKTTECYNWSGYAVTGTRGSVTNVKASWVVPMVTCSSSPDGYAAFWTGIDGWSSNTVEQIGTDSDCVNLTGTEADTPTYYAWFEFYPEGAYLIGNYTASGECQSDCVYPGDTISAEVTASGASPKGRHGSQSFTATITDETRGWTFTITSSVPGAQQSSAEWIAETPYGCNTNGGFCYLSDFGNAEYGVANTNVSGTASATVNGVTQALGSFSSVQEAIMVNYPSGTTIMAEPSPLQDAGTSFTDQWLSEGP